MVNIRKILLKKFGFSYEIIEIISSALLIALLLKHFVIASYYIPSSSMENTLKINDRIFAIKNNILKRKPNYRQIVIFKHPFKKDTFYIKRVIGLPNDKIQIYDGILYRNGIACKENYIKEKYIHGNFGPIIVPKNKIFLLGDNRNNSSDSRVFGAININSIEAFPILRYWPLKKIQKINRSKFVFNF